MCCCRYNSQDSCTLYVRIILFLWIERKKWEYVSAMMVEKRKIAPSDKMKEELARKLFPLSSFSIMFMLWGLQLYPMWIIKKELFSLICLISLYNYRTFCIIIFFIDLLYCVLYESQFVKRRLDSFIHRSWGRYHPAPRSWFTVPSGELYFPCLGDYTCS